VQIPSVFSLLVSFEPVFGRPFDLKLAGVVRSFGGCNSEPEKGHFSSHAFSLSTSACVMPAISKLEKLKGKRVQRPFSSAF